MMKTFPARWFAMLQQTFNPLIHLNNLPVLHRARLLVVMLLLNASAFTFGQAPSVSLSFPQFNSSYLSGTQINVQATATTPAGTTITKVEFYYATDFFSSGLDLQQYSGDFQAAIEAE